MSRQVPEWLSHEQGHFDIAEIYARRFKQKVNDTTIAGLSEYISFVMDTYKEVLVECSKEQDKYDIWTKNTMGKSYYADWIRDELKKQRG